MTTSNGRSMPTRRTMIKGALAAGVAAPVILRTRSAFAAYPDRPVKIIVANTPGGPSDIVGRITAAALQQSTGKTFIIENIGGAGRKYRIQQRRPIRTGRLHDPARNQCPFGQCQFVQQDSIRSAQGLCRRQRTGDVTQYVCGQIRPPGQDHEGIRRTCAGQSGKIQLRDAADRHNAADSARGSQAPGEASQAGRRGLQGWRRRHSGSAERDRTVELWLAAAGCAAHQGRHAALPCSHG